MAGRRGRESATEAVQRLMPEPHVSTRHAIDVRADPGIVYDAVLGLDLGRSLPVRTLFRLRGLPRSALGFEGLEALGFKPLVRSPGRALVLGLIGRFWTPTGMLLDFEPDGFVGFDDPGWAKAVWGFDVRPDGAGGTHLETVTRVHCTDARARRRFRAYWALVGPFSGLIRRRALELVRETAEAPRGTA